MHASVWFPNPLRESLNLPDGLSDNAILDSLVGLIRAGSIQVGRMADDGRFVPELPLSEDIIADVMKNQETDLFFSTRVEAYQTIKNAYQRPARPPPTSRISRPLRYSRTKDLP